MIIIIIIIIVIIAWLSCQYFRGHKRLRFFVLAKIAEIYGAQTFPILQ